MLVSDHSYRDLIQYKVGECIESVPSSKPKEGEDLIDIQIPMDIKQFFVFQQVAYGPARDPTDLIV